MERGGEEKKKKRESTRLGVVPAGNEKRGKAVGVAIGGREGGGGHPICLTVLLKEKKSLPQHPKLKEEGEENGAIPVLKKGTKENRRGKLFKRRKKGRGERNFFSIPAWRGKGKKRGLVFVGQCEKKKEKEKRGTNTISQASEENTAGKKERE